eukprot:189411-Rhodomonas_salina.1
MASDARDRLHRRLSSGTSLGAGASQLLPCLRCPEPPDKRERSSRVDNFSKGIKERAEMERKEEKRRSDVFDDDDDDDEFDGTVGGWVV